jgi:Putative zinc-finger
LSKGKPSAQEHPVLAMLALYAGRDLSWPTRWRLRRHLRHCASCEQQVTRLQRATAELRREAHAETLTGFEAIADWSLLEREMVGNISVGVAAARCVDHVGHRSLWLRMAVILGLAVLFAVGWITHIPRDQSERLLSALRQWAGLKATSTYDSVVRSSPTTLDVRFGDSTLTIVHPHSAVVSIAGRSALQARYLDDKTGQVIITGVYGQ